MMLVFLLIGGLVLPKFAVCVGFISVIARLVYTCMYVSKGPNARVIGALAGGLPMYALGLGATVEVIRLLA